MKKGDVDEADDFDFLEGVFPSLPDSPVGLLPEIRC